MKSYQINTVLTVAFAALLHFNPVHAQDCWNMPVTPTGQMLKAQQALRRGVAIEVMTSGEFADGWGVRMTEVEDAVHQGARAAGWEINQASNWSLIVLVQPVTKCGEDVYRFAVEVHAGDSQLQVSMEDEPGEVSGATAKGTVDVPKGDNIKVLNLTQQLVSMAARKLRNEILEQAASRFRPDAKPYQSRHILN